MIPPPSAGPSEVSDQVDEDGSPLAVTVDGGQSFPVWDKRFIDALGEAVDVTLGKDPPRMGDLSD